MTRCIAGAAAPGAGEVGVRRAALAVRATLGALLICAVTLPLLSGCALYNRVFHHGGNDAATCHERPFAANTESRPTAHGAAGSERARYAQCGQDSDAQRAGARAIQIRAVPGTAAEVLRRGADPGGQAGCAGIACQPGPDAAGARPGRNACITASRTAARHNCPAARCLLPSCAAHSARHRTIRECDAAGLVGAAAAGARALGRALWRYGC
jgi:hypothetical protein